MSVCIIKYIIRCIAGVMSLLFRLCFNAFVVTQRNILLGNFCSPLVVNSFSVGRKCGRHEQGCDYQQSGNSIGVVMCLYHRVEYVVIYARIVSVQR